MSLRLPYADVKFARHVLALGSLRRIDLADEDASVLRQAAAMLEDEPRRITPGYLDSFNQVCTRVASLIPQLEAA
ncbi:MAG TPA: hypothetical protein VLC92_01305 [Rhodocyclaceae bacterium]|nr:hypothetical protein [Rhodocyclaceae bacterium]